MSAAAGAASATRPAALHRATLVMAVGTLLSRLTGLARLIVTAIVLGIGPLADVFNLANTMPNVVHDLVLDGVLSATFVPVFVDRLATRAAAEAEESISAVVTLAGTVLVVSTLVFALAAPLIAWVYFGSQPAERDLATWLLLLFAPQLLAYGSISLMTALLNTSRRFAAPMYTPIVNNLVCIAVLAEFGVLARSTTATFVGHDATLILLLGGGTTLAVVLQAIALAPALRRSSVRARFLWRPRDPAVRTIFSLSGWTFGFVMANQIAVFVVLAFAARLGSGAVSEYTYGFTFFQLPFGIVAVSVMSAVTPELAERYSLGDIAAMRARFASGTRQILALVVPAAVGYLVLAPSVLTLLLRHNAAGSSQVHTTAAVVALLALGLPGYCTYLLAIRAFQAMRDTRTAFFLYVLENGINVLVAALLFVDDRRLGVRGLALSLSIAYTAAALVAYLVLRLRLGGLEGTRLARLLFRIGILSLVMAVVVATLDSAVGSSSGSGLLERVLVSVFGGILVYVGGAGLAGTTGAWQTARRRRRRRRRLLEEAHVRYPGRH
jgi:putative peptidoglycan lipid II flippase